MIKILHDEERLPNGGKCKDGTRFAFNDGEQDLIHIKTKETCNCYTFLSLLSNSKFTALKQELMNDLVKDKDNDPRTIAGVLIISNSIACTCVQLIEIMYRGTTWKQKW